MNRQMTKGASVDSAVERTQYEKAWSRLRFLIHRFWIVFFSFIPVAGTLCWLVSLFTKSIAVAVPAGIWMVYWLYCGVQLNMFICPRCSSKFFNHVIRLFGIPLGIYRNCYSGKCLNCGLQKYTFPHENGSLK